MNEKQFNTEVINSCEAVGIFAHKLADMPRMPGVTRFIGNKPCDILAGVWGRFVGIESKQIKKFQAISLSLFRHNQIKSLNEIVEKQNEAWALVNLRLPALEGQKRANVIFAFPWDTWGQAFQKGVKIGAKELREIYCLERWYNGFFITHGAKGIFPVDFLLSPRPKMTRLEQALAIEEVDNQEDDAC